MCNNNKQALLNLRDYLKERERKIVIPSKA